ncbi:MAG: hypothetical protein F6J93_25070 [Oscillatoria sp. SIO1A7]|nr:hypothetical protein [Oscillatoria sp. SIO1A7]
MTSRLEQLVTIAIAFFIVLASSGTRSNLKAPETRIPLADFPLQELVKNANKECPSGVPPKSKFAR